MGDYEVSYFRMSIRRELSECDPTKRAIFGCLYEENFPNVSLRNELFLDGYTKRTLRMGILRSELFSDSYTKRTFRMGDYEASYFWMSIRRKLSGWEYYEASYPGGVVSAAGRQSPRDGKGGGTTTVGFPGFG